MATKEIKPSEFEDKILKKKKLDKECSIKITQNQMSGRIFVEFSSSDGKLILQKSFQGTFDGTRESQEFAKTIRSINDLRKYFGIKTPKPVKISKVVKVELTEEGFSVTEKT